MLSLGKFPMQLQHNTLFHNPMSQKNHIQLKFIVSFSANRLKPFDFLAFPGQKSSGFCSNALKTKKKGGFDVSEMEGADNFEDDFDDDEFIDVEDDDEFEGDGDDDEVVLPLENMKKWFQNRPRGFGEGKVYDTSVEDKLMEETEQSRKAQLDNVNKLKSNSIRGNPKKELTKQDKASTQAPNGFRVRMVNLPKKMNIHKDLRLAFGGVPGILNILPVVSGNEKTRDPVCKGLAFIDFKFQDQAERFVEDFSGKSLSFGKVQKQIKCELLISESQPASDLLKSKSQKPASDQSPNKANCAPKEAVLSSENGFQAIVDTDIGFPSSREEEVADENYMVLQWEEEDEEIITSKFSEELEIKQELEIKSSISKQGRKIKQNGRKGAPDTKKEKISKLNITGSAKRFGLQAIVATNIAFPSSREEDCADENYMVAQLEKDDDEIMSKFSEELETKQELAVKSSVSKQGRKIRQNSRKGAPTPDTKKDKIPKLNIPGSAKRLRIREKSVLTGVFSKYGAKASSTVKEQNR